MGKSVRPVVYPIMMIHHSGHLFPVFLFRPHSQAPPTWPESPKGSQRSFDSTKIRSGKQNRFKSFDHTDPIVVTVGMCYIF
jgi:hypothetical protein